MVAPVRLYRVTAGVGAEAPDLLAIEEPLEIRVGYGSPDDRQQKTVAITMRTPGHDVELALGFLFAEGMLTTPDAVVSARHCVREAGEKGNVIRVELQPGTLPDWQLLNRHGYTSSSCGICGKTSIEAVRTVCPVAVRAPFQVDASVIQALPDQLRTYQRAFEHTGGIHAAALFGADGQLTAVREDIGRHNALDKLLGAAFWNRQLPLAQQGVLVSGRVGFELVQKCWMAGVPMLVAVGAPSSLAVELAREAGITLVGFVRNDRCNIYTAPDRVRVVQPA